jgi:hypothetical protein
MRPSAYHEAGLAALASVIAEKQYDLIKLEGELAREREELERHKAALMDAVKDVKSARLERDALKAECDALKADLAFQDAGFKEDATEINREMLEVLREYVLFEKECIKWQREPYYKRVFKAAEALIAKIEALTEPTTNHE